MLPANLNKPALNLSCFLSHKLIILCYNKLLLEDTKHVVTAYWCCKAVQLLATFEYKDFTHKT